MVPHTRREAGFVLLFFAVLTALLLGVPDSAFAQSSIVEISSTPNPVGSGARALGMGGAFIAVADDATAASWNPGGLVQLERPELAVVGEATWRQEKNTFARIPQFSGDQSVSRAGLNYLSATYPFTLENHNMVISLNYQHLFDFSRQWDLSSSDKMLQQTHHYEADGGLYAYGVAYSVQIIPQLSFGFTLNFWQDGIYRNGWEATNRTSALVSNFATVEATYKHRYSFTGFNANVGMLWNTTDRLTLGAVFKTPFTASLNHEYSDQFRVSYGGMTFDYGLSRTTNEELDMPMSYGFGLAYRFSDRLTVSADFYRTEWQDFVLTDAEGKRISPITKTSPGKSDIDPTNQFHLGAEYLFIQPKYTIPMRAGFFYDPAPAPHTPDDFYGVSLGTGIGIGRFVFDVAYMYRFGRNVGESLMSRSLKFSQDVNEHNLYTSLIIHF